MGGRGGPTCQALGMGLLSHRGWARKRVGQTIGWVGLWEKFHKGLPPNLRLGSAQPPICQVGSFFRRGLGEKLGAGTWRGGNWRSKFERSYGAFRVAEPPNWPVVWCVAPHAQVGRPTICRKGRILRVCIYCIRVVYIVCNLYKMT